MYVVTRTGRDDETLFLIDRNKTKSHWWSIDLTDAMLFRKESAANYSARRLKYGNPTVMNMGEAYEAERDNPGCDGDGDDDMGWDAHKNW